MSKFFKRAEFYYETAEEHYKKSKINNFEEHIALTCYYIHMSIEFNLKGLIEYYGKGVKYKHSHNISDHLVTIERIQKNIQEYNKLKKIIEQLEPWSAEITSWNTEARYNFNFVKTVNTIEKTKDISKTLVDFTRDI